ncbi:MAG: 4-hydroxythreonine-4-phosphate dehydrogenase, partial [Pseudomonadota bacterium]|nr:4-hydroxythreonine-4-phosphate dehydrogenase [Pseudomonadota bacterium]
MTLPLAVSLGDPAGVGAEVIAKSWERREGAALPPFFVAGDVAAFRAVWQG